MEGPAVGAWSDGIAGGMSAGAGTVADPVGVAVGGGTGWLAADGGLGAASPGGGGNGATVGAAVGICVGMGAAGTGAGSALGVIGVASDTEADWARAPSVVTKNQLASTTAAVRVMG